jgi:predicted phosphodiesterase
MRIAALYDIHGNLPALEAVLDEVARANVDSIVAGGDVVIGPMTRGVLRRLRECDIPVQFIRGNAEVAVLTEMRGGEHRRTYPDAWRALFRWEATELREFEETLASWPLTLDHDVDGIGDVLFCHATPRDDDELFVSTTPDDIVLPMFEGVEADVIVCGHTHMQFDRAIDRLRIVNAGSVGMPFGDAGADWLLLGPDVELRHTTYDLERAAERIRASTYPQAAEFAATTILNPPSAEMMLNAFANAVSR